MSRWQSVKIQALHDMRDLDRERRTITPGSVKIANSRRPVSAKAKAPRRIFKGQQLEHVVGQVEIALRGAHWSPFEFEGTARAGLRSRLCLDGETWDAADGEAAAVTAAALERIGAKRPTFEEGQREYTVAPDNCRWCGVEIPEELRDERVTYGFCCLEHAELARQHRDFTMRGLEDRVYSDIARVVQRAKNKPIECAHCSKRFHPWREGQKFCSTPCARQHEKMPDRLCRACGKPFHPKGSNTVFCSWECLNAVHYVDCAYCGQTFTAKDRKASLCSDVCKTAYYKSVKSDWVPRDLRPHVFDRFITTPANSRPPRLLPDRFDALVAAA